MEEVTSAMVQEVGESHGTVLAGLPEEDVPVRDHINHVCWNCIYNFGKKGFSSMLRGSTGLLANTL